MTDPNNQFFFIKRFRDKIVAAYLKSFDYIGSTIQCGQKDDRNMGRFGIRLQLLRNFKATHIRHHHIQQYQVGILFLYLVQCLISIASCHYVKLLIGQQYLQ